MNKQQQQYYQQQQQYYQHYYAQFQPPQPATYNRANTILWLLLAGGLGAHRFYTGRPGIAILIVLVTLIGAASGHIWLVLLWPGVDLILLLSRKFRDRYGRYV